MFKKLKRFGCPLCKGLLIFLKSFYIAANMTGDQ